MHFCIVFLGFENNLGKLQTAIAQSCKHLFCIVKLVNRVRENGEKMKKAKPTKEELKEMKALGIKRTDKKAVAAYYADKAAKAALAEQEAKKAAAEKARLDREANPTTEDLLKKILTVLESK